MTAAGRGGYAVAHRPDSPNTDTPCSTATPTRERAIAAQLWVETGRVFTNGLGEAIKPNTDYHAWKALLKRAGVRDARLHDARHAAATVLLVLGVPERTVMGIMGWSSTNMAARYQHVSDPIRRSVAKLVAGLLGPLTSVSSAEVGRRLGIMACDCGFVWLYRSARQAVMVRVM